MKNLSNFSHLALNNDETFEIKGGTFCFGNNYSSNNYCKPSTKTYSKPSYSNCNSSYSFSFGGFGGCNSKPKTCTPPAVVPPVVEERLPE